MPYLCEQGADKEHADSEGASPLLCACFLGDLDVRPYLCEQGADKEHADSGQTVAFKEAATVVNGAYVGFSCAVLSIFTATSHLSRTSMSRPILCTGPSQTA